MPEDPEVTFHPLSADKNPRFSSQVYSGEEPGSSGFGLTWEEGGKQQSDVFRSGDPLPGNISWKAPEDRYASPLPGGIGEVISVGPEYATFEFNVPVSDRYPEGRMRTRMNLGRTRGDYAQRMEALRREAQEGKDSQYGYEGASPEQIIALKKLMGSLSIMTPDLLRTSRQASLLERADRLSRQGDAPPRKDPTLGKIYRTTISLRQAKETWKMQALTASTLPRNQTVSNPSLTTRRTACEHLRSSLEGRLMSQATSLMGRRKDD